MKCFCCDRQFQSGKRMQAVTEDLAQTVDVGAVCWRKIYNAGADGYQPPLGGPKLYAPKFKPETGKERGG